MFQGGSDGLKPKTVQLRWSTNKVTNFLNQRWQFEVPLEFKGRIYFPFHAIATEKGLAKNREGPTISSIGWLITEIDQTVSRAKRVKVVLQGVFVWPLSSPHCSWTACKFGRCNNCGPEKQKDVSPDSSHLGNASFFLDQDVASCF